MGRVGSSKILGALESAGLPALFEPFQGTVEGKGLLRDPLLGQRLRCLYDCGCGDARRGARRLDPRARLAPGPALGVSLRCAEHTVAVKTTRVLDLSVVASALAGEHLRSTRFVLLLRDPRAVWASLRSFRGWAIRSPSFVCGALEMQRRTAPALAAVAPLLVLHYEWWAARPREALCLLARWAGFERLPTAWARGGAQIHARSLSAWHDRLPKGEVLALENDRRCARFMAKAGYHRTTNATFAPTDYSRVAHPLSALLAPLPPSVGALLPAEVEGCAAPSAAPRPATTHHHQHLGVSVQSRAQP